MYAQLCKRLAEQAPNFESSDDKVKKAFLKLHLFCGKNRKLRFIIFRGSRFWTKTHLPARKHVSVAT
jgi:hypothetical protein